MSRRTFPVFLMTAAFLLSSWSNVIAASFCPRYSARDFSAKIGQNRSAKSGPCHHEMARMDMEMDGGSAEMDDSRSDSQTPTSAQGPDKPNPASAVFELPDEPCGLCWMHSLPAPGTGTVVAQNPTSQSVETDAPPADAAIAPRSTFIIPITPVEHGPPGNGVPRRVLINVFRI